MGSNEGVRQVFYSSPLCQCVAEVCVIIVVPSVELFFSLCV